MSIVAKRLDGSRSNIGKEVGLGPDGIVLDGVPAPRPLMGHNPQFPPVSVMAKRLDGQ